MNILLIEDELRVADFIRRGLKAEGWQVEHAPDGETGLELVGAYPFDVVVLDLMLPGISGQDVCQRMRARKNHTPILMLTALDSTDERVAGLKLGADDYLPKPFDFDELIARIEALRRRAHEFSKGASDDVLAHDGLKYDRSALQLSVDGQEVTLSAKERELISMLMASPGKVHSRERILNAVWGTQEDPLTNVVDVYIARLRKKIAPYGDLISTVRGAGYRFGK
ncbi:response regulator transcription factor [Thalassococcus sp. S3]|uniref:response regulator transcription factor n=1 Tax=Thalassococcus sp. S3 TaxID=2017482 RepID=UPI0010244969|nr:response regulator transcription factor [Thalassococcus sp. S3]QBF30703.1 DNA-binding response regulator [Thalassococcus sp. S3]